MKGENNHLKEWSMVFVLFSMVSCDSLLIHREHEDVMDNEGESLFQPNKDFPVLSGDPGKKQMTKEEWDERIPKNKEEKKQFSQVQMLQKELSDLEDNLNDHEYEHYQLHKEKLSSISEKIYFLKISSIKQRDFFLFNKGKLDTFTQVNTDVRQAIRERSVVVGMSKEAVMQSWGRPVRVEVAGNPRWENERWSFLEYGKMKTVYFERGVVSGWDMD
jgi:hypothetical protein